MKPHSLSSRTLSGTTLITSSLETPTLDTRQYRVLRLPNALEVAIIHDPTTDRAAASMDVAVGSYSDRDDMPGMAHAVEHLLFMGTEKYPEDNAYNAFLNGRAGWSNAYTSSTSTNFYFEMAAGGGEKVEKKGEEAPRRVDGKDGEEELGVQTTKKDPDRLHVDTTPSDVPAVAGGGVSDSAAAPPPEKAAEQPAPLYGALDRFAQFFISPLFDASCLDRELNAVDSENKGNLQKDGRRIGQLSSGLANPEHRYSRFTTGNLSTLRDIPKAAGIDVREEFIKFHEREYSANRMKLCVLGRESLDELERWVTELFFSVPNKNLPENRFCDVPLLTEKELLTETLVKPIMDYHNLEIEFPCLAEDELWESQPNNYISHLIGHEGEGSILSLLKEKGWADGLTAGAARVCPGSYFFDVDIDLTEEGIAHCQETVKIVFQYIAMLRATEPQEWIFNEIRDVAEVDFRFSENASASNTTGGLSAVMQYSFLPREYLLSGYALVRKFKPELVEKALGFLRPDNFRLTLTSQKAPSTFPEKEKWYGTEYAHSKLPTPFLEELKSLTPHPSLHLPSKNEFIPHPSSLPLTKPTTSPPNPPNRIPHILTSTPRLRLFHKRDDTFHVPRTNIYIHLRSPLANHTPTYAILGSLFCTLVHDVLTERTYPAGIAGLGYSIRPKRGGLTACFWGYTPKLPLYLETVLKAVVGGVVGEATEGRFKAVKELTRKSLANEKLKAPTEVLGGVVGELVNNVYWTTDDLLVALEQVTLEDVVAHFREFFTPVFVSMMVHGSMDKAAARDLGKKVLSVLPETKIPLLPSQQANPRSVVIPTNANLRIEQPLADPAQKEGLVSILLLTGRVAERRNWCLTTLWNTVVTERAFQRLRTELQLGYTVYTANWNDGYTCGWRVVVQGSRDPEEVEGKMEEWLVSLRQVVREMREEEFLGFKKALMDKKAARYEGLGQESGSLWGNCVGGMWDFEEVERDCVVIAGLGRGDLVEWFEERVKPGGRGRGKVCVRLVAHGGKKDEEEKEKERSEGGEKKEGEGEEKEEKTEESSEPGTEKKQEKAEKEANGEMDEKKDKKKDDQKSSEEDRESESWKQPPVHIIDNIWKFKTTLGLSPAVQPVMQLEELLDLEPENEANGVAKGGGGEVKVETKKN